MKWQHKRLEQRFKINNSKLRVPVVTLFISGNIKFLENIKQKFKGKIWSKYTSETTQPKYNNLDYLIDPTFINFNRLFVLSLKNGNDFLTRYPFDKYYMSLVEIKEFNFNWQSSNFWSTSEELSKKNCQNFKK